MQPEFTLGAGDIPDHMIPARVRIEHELLDRPGCPDCPTLRAALDLAEAQRAALLEQLVALRGENALLLAILREKP